MANTMSREAFDIEAALEKCHKGTAWQRDLIRAQLIAAQADAYKRAAKIARGEMQDAGQSGNRDADDAARRILSAIEALAKESNP